MPELRDLIELPGSRQASYEVIGEGEPALYFQGGPGVSASLLRDDAELLSDLFAVYLIDPPGSGRSSPPENPAGYDHIGHARFYDEVRRAIGIEQATIMGVSFGGVVALTFAALFPEATSRCVAIATSAMGSELAGEEAAGEMQNMLARHADAPWFTQAKETWDNWTERVLAAGDAAEVDRMMSVVMPLYTAYPDRPGVTQMIELYRREVRTNLEAVKAWENGLDQRIDVRPLLSSVRAPTLVLAGELDLVCGPAHARALGKALPHATVEIITDAGHKLFAEAPVGIRRAIEAFTR